MNAALHTEADAVTRLAAARPLVIDVVPASEISEHHAGGGVTHAGPPIEPQRMCPPMRAALASALFIEGVAGSPADAVTVITIFPVLGCVAELAARAGRLMVGR